MRPITGQRRSTHCVYQALIVAIATRHADAIDIKFLVDGRPVWVALPHPAWVEYKKQTGKLITDPLAIEIAGHYLKNMLLERAKVWAVRCIPSPSTRLCVTSIRSCSSVQIPAAANS